MQMTPVSHSAAAAALLRAHHERDELTSNLWSDVSAEDTADTSFPRRLGLCAGARLLFALDLCFYRLPRVHHRLAAALFSLVPHQTFGMQIKALILFAANSFVFSVHSSKQKANYTAFCSYRACCVSFDSNS